MENNYIPRNGPSDIFYPGLGNLGNEQYAIPHATAPPCSEFSYNSASEFGDRKVCDEESDKKWPLVSDEEKRKEFNEFVSSLRDQVNAFINRLMTAKNRNRSVTADPTIQKLFLQISESLTELLNRKDKLEADREYYEEHQDKISLIYEARQAINSLRDEHRREEAARRQVEHMRRQQRMTSKLVELRKQKESFVHQHRQAALQRFQETSTSNRNSFHQQQQPGLYQPHPYPPMGPIPGQQVPYNVMGPQQQQPLGGRQQPAYPQLQNNEGMPSYGQQNYQQPPHPEQMPYYGGQYPQYGNIPHQMYGHPQQMPAQYNQYAPQQPPVPPVQAPYNNPPMGNQQQQHPVPHQQHPESQTHGGVHENNQNSSKPSEAVIVDDLISFD
uniref:Hrs_helical domain-containing protein n=1 Tax=Strongyloides venezuelensis TaxID=75913 RepID=A0A0K0F000_STRVS